ncbi:PEP-CTERM sorting domain-containing protein [Paludibaculum fermentans]|uniref:PEP-CTERM sorting domain-containing protein n=1 Tax=Paludibaculum fermentans TaxID=1473598 RepID=A0A7S7NPK2_PALFE|nr:PEP-CTERM sorting domain-containing protein [Paludibaculum fermentans]QOY87438.1 PEP-CTERM sorting domain-containing protein [Paludibaculum fermentans]
MKAVFLLATLVVPGLSYGATLNAASVANNGAGGIFMAITAAGSAITVTSFDLFFDGAAPGTSPVEVYTRPGTYTGFENSNAGWTLTQTVVANTPGTTATLAPLTLTTGITIGAGQTLAVYLQSTSFLNGIYYNGNFQAPPTTTWSNVDLSLFSDTAMIGDVAFSGSLFTSRTLAGNVNYSLGTAAVPEPGTVSLLGLGFAGLVWLRRRRA